MPRFDATNAEARVFTYKEGLLSAIAHDLELRITTFTLEVADDFSSVTGTFDIRSLRVVDAVIDGRRSPGTLSAKDKAKIESNIVSEVIPQKRGHEVTFTSSAIQKVDGGWEIRGRLELAGRARDITVPVWRDDGDTVVGEVTLHQPDYGIKPYSAMLGTLKIQPDVKVHVEVSLPAD